MSPRRPYSMPHPFLKWVGGKRQLLPELLKCIPKKAGFKRYHEPFVGGGALFFELRRRELLGRSHPYLSDTNPNLIETYVAVRDHVEELIELLKQHKINHTNNPKEYFYGTRADVPDSPVDRAARIIYLNKTCFNGLYRENSKGLFNAPLGKYKNPKICDEENLRSASLALQNTDLAARSFDTVLEKAQKQDLVYFDPPYHPVSKTASFTSYARDGFGEEGQRRLAEVFAQLADKGVQVILSNSDTPFIRDLYAEFKIRAVTATRNVNSRATGRGKVGEVIVTSKRR